MRILYGNEILTWVTGAEDLLHRNIFTHVEQYIHSGPSDSVGILFGLRRTGKTTLLRHLVLSFSEQDLQKTPLFLSADNDSSMLFIKNIEKLEQDGYHFILVDEFTKLNDYRSIATDLSDYFAPKGIKFLFSGTHSLGFKVAEKDEWFDRAHFFPTTHIPFCEWSLLIGNNSIKSYLRHGGILAPMDGRQRGFSNIDLIATYIDTSVCGNILHAPETEDKPYRHPAMRELLRQGRLEDIIRLVVIDELHRIFPVVFRDDKRSYGDAANFCTSIFNAISAYCDKNLNQEDRENVISQVEKDISFTLLINDDFFELARKEIKHYLEEMDLLHPFPFELFYPKCGPTENIKLLEKIYHIYSRYHTIPQPGLRMSIIVAILTSMAKHPIIQKCSQIRKMQRDFLIVPWPKFMDICSKNA